jgi:phytoene dehydrogenase-like protein
MLAVAGHAVGWPFARGGSRNVTRALAAELFSSGGQIETGRRIDRLGDLPRTDAVLLDLTPRQVLRIAGDRLPPSYRRGLAGYRYGPGVFKLDWALSEPIPWRARGCARAGTVHLGGSLEDIAGSVRRTWRGRPDANPFVLVAQPTCFDASRAPAGRHVAWGYIRVPRGSGRDFTEVVERQIERFAPGFQDVIIGRSARTAVDLERHNPNLVGGDITGGSQDMRQLFFRPVPRIDPYSTPVEGLYLCSSSTPPGGGVHGMCGFHAAHSALRRLGSS